jgi:hypothetical protein
MRRCAWLLLLIACGYLSKGPGTNEAVTKAGRKVAWRAPIALATFCPSCGRDAPVTIEFGAPARARLVIPLCYAHAQSKVGDHDNFQIALVEGNVAATEGELDIEDCTSKHVTATVWAKFPDDRRIEAKIDTELRDPGK